MCDKWQHCAPPLDGPPTPLHHPPTACTCLLLLHLWCFVPSHAMGLAGEKCGNVLMVESREIPTGLLRSCACLFESRAKFARHELRHTHHQANRKNAIYTPRIAVFGIQIWFIYIWFRLRTEMGCGRLGVGCWNGAEFMMIIVEMSATRSWWVQWDNCIPKWMSDGWWWANDNIYIESVWVLRVHLYRHIVLWSAASIW